jgi:hypothetical protein
MAIPLSASLSRRLGGMVKNTPEKQPFNTHWSEKLVELCSGKAWLARALQFSAI